MMKRIGRRNVVMSDGTVENRIIYESDLGTLKMNRMGEYKDVEVRRDGSIRVVG